MKSAKIKLGDACEFIRGVTFPSGEGDKKPFEGAIACLTTSGVQREVAWESRRFIPRTRVGKDSQLLRAGDILISTANSRELVGKSCLVHRTPFDCTFGAFVTGVRPAKSVLPRYLAFWMTTPEFLGWCYKRSTNTTNISNVRVSELEELEFFLPPLNEQQQISEQLEQADRLRRTRRYALELSETFLPAAFLELFGSPSSTTKQFPVCELGEETKFIDYRGIAPNKVKRGVRLVTARNVKRGSFEIEPQEFIPAEEYDSWMTRGMPQTGDVLFTTEGHTLGSAAKLPTFDKVALGQRLIVLQPGIRLGSDYLLHLILTTWFQDEVAKRTTGSAARGISSRQLAEIRVPLPPLELQQKFSVLVERHERLRATQREALRQSEHLFKTLLHQAFSEPS